MRIHPRLQIVGIVAIAGALTLVGSPAYAWSGASAYTCAGGDIPSGTYASLTVTGACSVPADAVITVTGNVTVERGAMLDAQSAPAMLTVRRNVTAMPGAMLGLGCQPPSLVGNTAHPCMVNPEGHSTITVHGNVTALGASGVFLNGITVRGSVAVLGGSSPMPWPIKNNTIRGSLTVIGLTVEWLGVMFNHVGGNVTLLEITIHDVDPGAPGVYVVHNTVGWNLVCYGLTPGVSGGFVPGSVNVVGHKALGQCSALV